MEGHHQNLLLRGDFHQSGPDQRRSPNVESGGQLIGGDPVQVAALVFLPGIRYLGQDGLDRSLSGIRNEHRP
ncbi:hypothetical protein GCM10027456_32370 [Kineosporia babensis]